MMILLSLKRNTGKMIKKVKKQLELIKKENSKINAVLELNPDALKEAKEIEKKIRQKKAGKLAGLTCVIKANINVIGMNINCGSKTLENYKGTFDADVITKLKKEDALILGTANLDEFACGSSGETSFFGPTINPKAKGFIPGGSSSGSAAAVAANFCDFALGSDTGGSIRNPASHCGILGLKPSYGAVSRYGLVDLSMSLDQIGPLANDVKTLRNVYSVISGYSENDPTTFEKSARKKQVNKLRIGISKDFEKLCDKKIYKKILEKTLEFAKKTNSKIVEVSLKHLKLAVATYYPIVYTEFFSGTRKFDGRRFGLRIEESCGDEVLRRLLGGKEISRSEHEGKFYRKALAVKKLIKEDFDNAFKKCDIIISPVTPKLPHKIGDKISVLDMYSYDAFTGPANLAGITGISVPLTKINNLPVGIQVLANSFQEELLFDVAEKL